MLGCFNHFVHSGRAIQLWLFWVAPIVGALIGGFVYRWLGAEEKAKIVGEPARSAHT